MPQMDVDTDITQRITRDSEISNLIRIARAAPEQPDIRRARSCVRVLNRAAGYGALQDRTLPRIEEYVGGRRPLGIHVGFDVAGPDLNVPDLRTPSDNPTASVVADVCPEILI